MCRPKFKYKWQIFEQSLYPPLIFCLQTTSCLPELRDMHIISHKAALGKVGLRGLKPIIFGACVRQENHI